MIPSSPVSFVVVCLPERIRFFITQGCIVISLFDFFDPSLEERHRRRWILVSPSWRSSNLPCHPNVSSLGLWCGFLWIESSPFVSVKSALRRIILEQILSILPVEFYCVVVAMKERGLVRQSHCETLTWTKRMRLSGISTISKSIEW